MRILILAMLMAATVALIGLAGCSFIGVRSHPTAPWIGDGPARCNGYGLPGVDAVFAAAGLAVAGATGARAVQVQGTAQDGPAFTWLFLGLPALAVGLVEAVATTYGFAEVHRCRAGERP